MPSKIEWTDEAWNPFTGCTKLSPGCKNCYAKQMANRLKGRYGYPSENPFEPTFHPGRIDKPKSWRKMRLVFVCSMADLWHGKNEWVDIDKVFFTCHHHEAEWHTYLFLTKRIETAWYYFKSPIYSKPHIKRSEFLKHKNIWLGITAEDQEHLERRMQFLEKIPASVRFVSVEPMLGRMDLTPWLPHALDWVICGGESGPGARPIHPDWPRSLRDQCQEAEVPFFFKQWGEYITAYDAGYRSEDIDQWKQSFGQAWVRSKRDWRFDDGTQMVHVGKKAAGRLLDGIEWNQYPEP